MASCNLTEYIHDHECIGDSLKKINQNFINLESKVCEIPTVKSGPGIKVQQQITEQKDSQYVVSTTNSFDYRTTFDSYNNFAGSSVLQLSDQTTLNTTKFPYSNIEADVKPTVTFTTLSRQSDSIPKVTLYWTAGTTPDNITVFPLNSAVDETARGSIWFNDTVTSLLSSNGKFYVGGAFTQVGGLFAQKLVEISNTDGTGSYITEPIPNLGSIGEVKTIKEADITISGTTHRLLIAGGSFESIGVRGRGLVILDKQTGLFYPWYVNGEVNSVFVYGNLLYVGGNFDYVNYGSSSMSVYSGQRFQTNGFFTINLPSLINGLAVSSATNYSSPFAERATINSFALYDKYLYIGGEFKIKQSDKITNQNLYSIDLSPTVATSGPSMGFVDLWAPMSTFQTILNGPVNGLHIDSSISTGGSAYLYVGGNFSKIYTSSEYYNEPRIKLEKTNVSNAVCFQLTDLSTLKTNPALTTWKPSFRGPVTSFVSHDNMADSLVYCYGQFNSVNDISVSYLTAIKKASSLTSGQVFPNWFPGIQNGPAKINTSIVKDGNAIIFGGNFSEISGKYRYNLAKISCPASATFPIVVWDCGGEVITPGSKLTMDMYSSNTMRVSSVVFDGERVHATVFPAMKETFAGLTPGQPIRFFIRRPGLSCYTNDTYTDPVHVIGWKVDFNQ